MSLLGSAAEMRLHEASAWVWNGHGVVALRRLDTRVDAQPSRLVGAAGPYREAAGRAVHVLTARETWMIDTKS